MRLSLSADTEMSWRTEAEANWLRRLPYARFVPRMGMKPNEGRVLVVDDDPQIRRVMRTTLEAKGTRSTKPDRANRLWNWPVPRNTI